MTSAITIADGGPRRAAALGDVLPTAHEQRPQAHQHDRGGEERARPSDCGPEARAPDPERPRRQAGPAARDEDDHPDQDRVAEQEPEPVEDVGLLAAERHHQAERGGLAAHEAEHDGGDGRGRPPARDAAARGGSGALRHGRGGGGHGAPVPG